MIMAVLPARHRFEIEKARADFSAVNEVGAALYTKGTEYNSTVSFIRYDDGWRVIEGSALKNIQGLNDALKNASPLP